MAKSLTPKSVLPVHEMSTIVLRYDNLPKAFEMCVVSPHFVHTRGHSEEEQ